MRTRVFAAPPRRPTMFVAVLSRVSAPLVMVIVPNATPPVPERTVLPWKAPKVPVELLEPVRVRVPEPILIAFKEAMAATL